MDEPIDLAASIDRLRSQWETQPQRPERAHDPALAKAVEEVRRLSRRAWWDSNVPEMFMSASLYDYEPGAALDGLRDWAAGPRGRNLVVFGCIGAGKTHSVFAACRRLVVEEGLDLEFQPVGEMLDDLSPRGPEGLAARLMACGILALDDLGTEKRTEFSVGALYKLVNRRWMERRPVVATTNLLPEKRAKTLGAPGPYWESVDERLRSRLTGSGAVTVFLGGGDRRQTRA